MQGCHQAQVRDPIERFNLFVGVMPLQEQDRFPVVSLEAPVNAFGLRLDFRNQVLITRDMRAAGCANLDKRKSSDVGRMPFQETLNPTEAFRDTLGVIQAIDSDSHKLGL